MENQADKTDTRKIEKKKKKQTRKKEKKNKTRSRKTENSKKKSKGNKRNEKKEMKKKYKGRKNEKTETKTKPNLPFPGPTIPRVACQRTDDSLGAGHTEPGVCVCANASPRRRRLYRDISVNC